MTRVARYLPSCCHLYRRKFQLFGLLCYLVPNWEPAIVFLAVLRRVGQDPSMWSRTGRTTCKRAVRWSYRQCRCLRFSTRCIWRIWNATSWLSFQAPWLPRSISTPMLCQYVPLLLSPVVRKDYGNTIVRAGTTGTSIYLCPITTWRLSTYTVGSYFSRFWGFWRCFEILIRFCVKYILKYS